MGRNVNPGPVVPSTLHRLTGWVSGKAVGGGPAARSALVSARKLRAHTPHPGVFLFPSLMLLGSLTFHLLKCKLACHSIPAWMCRNLLDVCVGSCGSQAQFPYDARAWTWSPV